MIPKPPKQVQTPNIFWRFGGLLSNLMATNANVYMYLSIKGHIGLVGLVGMVRMVGMVGIGGTGWAVWADCADWAGWAGWVGYAGRAGWAGWGKDEIGLFL